MAKKPPSSTLQESKNRVRGAIGSSQARTMEKVSKPRSELYRENLRSTLVRLRPSLTESGRPEFFDWLKRVSAGPGTLSAKTIAFELIPYIYEAPRVSLSSDIDWIIWRLLPHLGELAEFRHCAERLDHAFWRGDNVTCFEVIEHIEASFGLSAWIIEARLGLEQHFNGLEAQKSALAGWKSRYGNGYPSYFAHFISIRNEERSTLRLFRADARRRIADTDLAREPKDYLRFRIVDDFDGTDVQCSAILRSEQSQSIIDIYETTIRLFQRLVIANRVDRYSTPIAAALEAWAPVQDFRTSKIMMSVRGVSQFDLQTTVDTLRSRAASEDHSSQEPSIMNVWGSLASAIHGKDRHALDHLRAQRVTTALRDLPNLMQRGSDFEPQLGEVLKSCRNLGCLTTALSYYDALVGIFELNSENRLGFGASALNTKMISVSDTLLPPDDTDAFGTDSEECDSPALTRFACRSREFRRSTPATNVISGEVVKLAGSSRSEEAALASVELAFALDRDDLAAGICIIADEAARSPGARGVLPVQALIRERPWSELAAITPKADLAISLDVLWRQTGSDLRATHLRFAFEDALSEAGVERPSKLIDGHTLSRDKLLYFLKWVSTPSTMDLAGVFTGSEDLTDERVLILKQIAVELESDVDTRDELEEIQSRRLIKSGLDIVDSSRVHVDATALSRWARDLYAESFARYKALVSAGIGVSEDFESTLRRALRSGQPEQNFNIPDNEADSLLLEMILALREQFLHNSEFGLQFFLGKRIRHGTITGHLRSPIENAKLITQRVTEGGAYRANSFWLDRLKFADTSSQEQASFYFTEFSTSYDALIDNLRDTELQVRSRQKPKGLFDIVVTAASYHILRSAIQTDISFSGFLQSCYSVFWGLLQPPLVAARDLIAQEMKTQAVTALDRLLAGIKGLAQPDVAYQELSTSLRVASVEMQRQFDTMAEWFRRAEVEQAIHYFDLQTLVRIALESALQTHKSFQPKVSTSVVGDLLVSSVDLVIVADIIFVVIDNIARRAKAGLTPDIEIKCEFDKNSETLLFNITNPIGSGVDLELAEMTLADIRGRIAKGDISAGAQSEGGSGLLKIAALVAHSERAEFDFGFEGSDSFRTKVRLAVIRSQSEPIN